MFGRASSFNKDISSWNTAAVTNMYQMFQHASSFNKDISSWNTAAVTDWSGMFYNATAWLASFHRVDGTSSTDGPPSAWSFIPSPPPPPSPSSPPPPNSSLGSSSNSPLLAIVIALVVTPSTIFSVLFFFFKPFLRRLLLSCGCIRVADCVVPADAHKSINALQLKVSEIENFMAKQKLPRLRDTAAEIQATEVQLHENGILGVGGYGTVYKATYKNKTVAVKTVFAETTGGAISLPRRWWQTCGRRLSS